MQQFNVISKFLKGLLCMYEYQRDCDKTFCNFIQYM